jgi:hypothetical protein
MSIFTKTSIRHLVAAGAATASLLALAPGSASADLGYTSGATITQTGLDVHGTWARLEWTTNVSVTKIEVATSAPKQVNGAWVVDNPVHSSSVPKVDGGFAKSVTGLKPSTKYNVILTTPAMSNLPSTQALGQFTTLTRTQVHVTFDEIHVSDDADGFGKGAGDLWWYFDTSFSGWSNGWHRPASSGDTFTVDYHDGGSSHGQGNFEVTGSNVPYSFKLSTQAIEDDISFGDVGCAGLWETQTNLPHQGSTTCADSAYATKTLTLPTFVFEDSVQAFTMTTDSGRVKFTVTGTYQATYA